MTYYSEEFRANVAARLLPPNNARIADIVKETGVPKDTLYDWRARYRNKQGLSPSSCKSSNQYSADDKLAVIIETATLNPDRHGGEIMVTDPIGVEMRENIVEAAARVFGSEATAKVWLHAPVPELGGDIPEIVLLEEGGFERVLKALEVRADLELTPIQRIIRITELIEADASGAEFQSLSLDRVLGEIRNYSIAASKLKIAKIVAEASQTAERLKVAEQCKSDLDAAILHLYGAFFETNQFLIMIHDDSIPAGGLTGFNNYNEFSTWIGTWVADFSEEVRKSGDKRFVKALLADYEQVYERTVEVFKDEENALKWLYGRIPALGGKIPALILDEPGGVDLVLGTLTDIE